MIKTFIYGAVVAFLVAQSAAVPALHANAVAPLHMASSH